MSDIVYSDSPELKQLAEEMKERYYEYLGQVDIDVIDFTEKTGTMPKKAKTGNDKLYNLAVWGEAWDDLAPSTREWLVFKMLYSLDPESAGKVRKPDVNEFGIMIEYFCSIGIGPHWEKADGQLPSLMDGASPLPIPLPPLEQDDGSTV